MADDKNKKKEKPKLIVFKEGEFYRSVDDMPRKDSREIKRDKD